MWSPRRSDERIPYQKVWDVSIVTRRSGQSVLCASSAYQTAGNMHFPTIFQSAYFASFSQTLWIAMEACAGIWNLWAKSEKFKILGPTSTRIKRFFFICLLESGRKLTEPKELQFKEGDWHKDNEEAWKILTVRNRGQAEGISLWLSHCYRPSTGGSWDDMRNRVRTCCNCSFCMSMNEFPNRWNGSVPPWHFSCPVIANSVFGWGNIA